MHSLTRDQACNHLTDALCTRETIIVGMLNAAKIVKMRTDSQLRQAVLSADLLLADGMAVVWASRILRCGLPERVAGVDLMEDLLSLCDRRHGRLFLLGSTREVVEAARRQLARRFPHITAVGTHHGYFAESEAGAIARMVGEFRPDVLLVGISSPRKEVFLAEWGRTMDVPICHGVGGGFDILAGKVRRAPLFLQNVGLEWLYRVWQEPRRLWRRYLVTNAIFLALVLRAAAVRTSSALFRKTLGH